MMVSLTNSLISTACSPSMQTCLVKKPFSYGPYILVMIPIVAITIGWFIRRFVIKLDTANAERYESMRRHDKNNAEAVATLTIIQSKNVTELSERLIKTQETLTALYTEAVQRIARMEGSLDIRESKRTRSTDSGRS